MASDNVELVRTLYAHFRAGDNDAALELIHPEVVIRDRPEVPDPQVYRGHAGVLRSLGSNVSAFESLDMVPEEFIDRGDDVVVVFRFRAVGRESGIPVDERLAHLWTVRHGKAVRMTVHSSRAEALAAAATASPRHPRSARPAPCGPKRRRARRVPPARRS